MQDKKCCFCEHRFFLVLEEKEVCNHSNAAERATREMPINPVDPYDKFHWKYRVIENSFVEAPEWCPLKPLKKEKDS